MRRPFLTAARRVGGAVVSSIHGLTYPATEPNKFAQLVTTEDRAEIVDQTNWAIQNNDAAFSFSGGKIVSTGAQIAARQLTLTTAIAGVGRKLGSVGYVDTLGGTPSLTLAAANATSSTTGSKTTAGRYMTNLTGNHATNAIGSRVSFGAGASGSLESIHIFDLDAMLALPWFIIPVESQSNWVGSTRVLDPAIDLPAYGCLAWPGATNAARGWTVDGSGYGVPALAVDPMQHTFAVNTGGGPGGAFLREMRKHVPEGMIPMYVCTGYAGAGFAGNGLWNKDATSPTAYNNFFFQLNEVWSRAPAGSVMGCIVSCGGESDLGSGQTPERRTRWLAMMNLIRSTTGWNQPKGGGVTFTIPIVIAEIGGDSSRTEWTNGDIPAMIAMQSKFDSNSGHADALPACTYVAAPAGSHERMYAGDGLYIHYVQADDRIRGKMVARAAANLAFPGLNLDIAA